MILLNKKIYTTGGIPMTEILDFFREIYEMRLLMEKELLVPLIIFGIIIIAMFLLFAVWLNKK